MPTFWWAFKPFGWKTGLESNQSEFQSENLSKEELEILGFISLNEQIEL